jgi:hypothetical protein
LTAKVEELRPTIIGLCEDLIKDPNLCSHSLLQTVCFILAEFGPTLTLNDTINGKLTAYLIANPKLPFELVVQMFYLFRKQEVVFDIAATQQEPCPELIWL